MKRSARTFAATPAVLGLGLLMSLVPHKEAHGSAATLVDVVNTAARPVLSKNADEPGRIPFETTVAFTNRKCVNNCSNFVPAGIIPNVSFQASAPVPAGLQLIIKHVHGLIASTGSVGVAFQEDAPRKWAIFGPFFVDASGASRNFTVETFFTYHEFQSPAIAVSMPSPTSSISSITISGYLIHAAN